MNIKQLILPLFVLILFSSSFVLAQNKVDLLFFYGAGCSHCAKLDLYLQGLEEKYPTLSIQRYEIYSNKENRDFYFKLANAYNMDVTKVPVPVTFINDKVFVGASPETEKDLEKEIEKCLKEECALRKIEGEAKLKTLTLSAVILGAAVDAINPCEFAVLIILLATMLGLSVAENKKGKRVKRVLYAGIAFSVAVYISYFLMGFGIFTIIKKAAITHIFYIIVAILAILIGLFNLKDYLWYGKGFLMEVPRAWRPRLKSLIKGVTSVPGAFLIGILVSLILTPCTSGPYIAILGLLAESVTRNVALYYLLLYNLIFILPMLIITLVIYYGFTTVEKAEEWRTRKLKILHLIAGIIILLLGITMLIAVKFGWV